MYKEEFRLLKAERPFAQDKSGRRNANRVQIVLQKDIVSFLNIAYPLCFIMMERNLKAWYYEQFINVFAQTWFGNFFRPDYLDANKVFGDILERHSYKDTEIKSDIIEFTLSKIDAGYGLIVFALDEYFIPERPSYLKTHSIHELLIYGYDNETERMLVVGYDRDGIFTNFSIGYDSYKAAYDEACRDLPHYLPDVLHLIRVRHFYYEYPYNPKRVLDELEMYLSAVPDSKKKFFAIADRSETVYGFGIYEKLLHIVDNILSGDVSVRFDLTTVHFLHEHKMIVKDRLDYLAADLNVGEDLAQVIAQYRSVVSDFLEIKLLFIKEFHEPLVQKGHVVGAELNLEALRTLKAMMVAAKDREYALTKGICDELQRLVAT